MVDGTNSATAEFTDGACTTCATTGPGNHEIFDANGGTPIAGALLGARRYWQGLQRSDNSVIWPTNTVGFDPIGSDPTHEVFIGNQQCRPYITIMLTDGGETCSGDPPGAATQLLSTPYAGRTYRIETKPIGYGITPGNAAIEALAHAGGAVDVAGDHEGFYAANEEELQIAISRIVADSVRSEVCNNADDDCDTRIDEDFPSKGSACDDGELGACRGTGSYVCKADGTGTECQITNAGASAVAETCNMSDDDCDGLVDEGVCVGCLNVELCNNQDDDCDTRVDEDLTRSCGSNVGECRLGTEVCAAGSWSGCTGVTPTTEVCDGRDNDCDGTRDGLAESCVGLPGNQPGVGICRAGTRTCPTSGSGQFGACLNEVGPRVEACNTLDDDCDGQTDESTGGARCTTTCGVGTTVCVNGVLQCNAQPALNDETCDGNDDDCDNLIDENAPDGGACDAGGTICGGVLACVGGAYRCTGGAPIRQESCDCSDNDCDTRIDESPNCPAGATCQNCECAFPCGEGEFPCPAGRVCKDNFCVADKCYGVTCGPDATGDATVCVEGACVNACAQRSCGPGAVCLPRTGQCAPDNCTTFADRCAANERCVAGTCVIDKCAGVTCDSGAYCRDGACVGSCAGVECKKGELCEAGACRATRCEAGCPRGTYCNEIAGGCSPSKCVDGQQCATGQTCEPKTGECVTDPCLGVTCPSATQVCQNGSCYDRNQLPPDGTAQQFVTAAGGGCSASGAADAGLLVSGAMLGLLWGGVGRRRRGQHDGAATRVRRSWLRGARVGKLAIWAGFSGGLFVQASCGINDYCINCALLADAALDGTAPADGALSDGPVFGDAANCVPDGFEICDGKDNDCNGQTDDGSLPGVGETCGEAIGECTVGTRVCENGVLRCSGVAATPELCDNKDNDCDGMIDDGDPQGGGACGTDVGECIAGVNRCVNGAVTCIGAVGAVDAVPEACDGKDNDCDGMIDDGLAALGSCGTSDVGECALGTLMCVGGAAACVGEVGPAFELCDALDQDCDGDPVNGYDLMGDARNCGACGNICMVANATPACRNGACAVGACAPGYFDNDANSNNGCEYGPCTFNGPAEACNGVDDNCNGQVDDGLTPPAICRQVGACAGAMAMCTGASGWVCNYGPDVAVDGTGAIQPETECDGIDNDCDGRIDESHADKGAVCGDGQNGICRATGVRTCDPADKRAPTVCTITTPGQAPAPEACNHLDDDCDGVIDNGAASGNLEGQAWVSLGGVQIMKYEASRADATATNGGSSSATVCARPNVQPWVNVTAPQAAAACTSIGARLCTEAEWHRACAVIDGVSWPVAGPVDGTVAGRVFFEAEQYQRATPATAGGVTRAWVPDAAQGFSGMSALRASPNLGVTVAVADAPTLAPRLDYQVNFAAAGNHYVWVRMYSASTSEDSLWVGINPTAPGTAFGTALTTSAHNQWLWVRSGAINVPAAGVRTVSLYMREDGLRVDAVGIARDTLMTAPSFATAAGATWAYASDSSTAQDLTCNAQPLDTDGNLSGNQDGILPTGTLPQCYANGADANDAYDLSGNVREWTAPRMAGANPIRGGASNATVAGTSCALNFTLADDAFFFPNVGFRCCR